MKQTKRFEIRIDPDTRRTLHTLAATEKKSEAALIRDLINQKAAATSISAAINDKQLAY